MVLAGKLLQASKQRFFSELCLLVLLHNFSLRVKEGGRWGGREREREREREDSEKEREMESEKWREREREGKDKEKTKQRKETNKPSQQTLQAKKQESSSHASAPSLRGGVLERQSVRPIWCQVTIVLRR